VGALGRHSQYFELELEAETKEAARLATYEHYEHISGGGPGLRVLDITVYCTSYCNKGHRMRDGVPVSHECYVLPPAALEAEWAGNYERAQELLQEKPLRRHTGARNAKEADGEERTES